MLLGKCVFKIVKVFMTHNCHDDVIKWKHFPHYWLFVRESTGLHWSPVDFLTVTQYFDVFYLRLNKRLNKQSRRRWFETPSISIWRRCNGNCVNNILTIGYLFRMWSAVCDAIYSNVADQVAYAAAQYTPLETLCTIRAKYNPKY